MYIPYQEQAVLQREILEASQEEQTHLHGQTSHSVVWLLAVLAVKLGRTLERTGQAYLK